MLWRLKKSVWRDGFVGRSSPCCESMRNCVQIPRAHVIIWHAMHACNPSAVGGKDRRISGVSWHEHSFRFLSSEWSTIGYPIFFSGLHNVTESEKKNFKKSTEGNLIKKGKKRKSCTKDYKKWPFKNTLHTLLLKKATAHCI